ncbi:MAG: hypothetical protein H6832_16480 [Planctomycetes bacterium]|nr:hypothetical protein [Planctomycetota bacterium]MCB9892546.1 hypothetical protein [Planctomycetota bacterium]MCB9920000.1 hypothetical protein [Planctomycetota bacterium]
MSQPRFRARALRSCSACVFVAVLATTASAQNLVDNGNFESSTTSYAPWTLINATNASNARVAAADVGFPEAGQDHVFACGVIATTGGDVGIEQEFEITTALGAGRYWVGAIVTNPNYANRGSTNYRTLIERQDGSNWVSVIDLARTISTAEGPIEETLDLALAKYRIRFLARAEDVGTSDFFVDDCVVRKVASPVPLFEMYRTGDREFLLIDLPVRDAKTITVLFASQFRLSQGLTIPGVEGLFELDANRGVGLIQLGAGSGNWTYRIPRDPLVSIGQTIFFQAFEIGPAFSFFRFGSRTALAPQR